MLRPTQIMKDLPTSRECRSPRVLPGAAHRMQPWLALVATCLCLLPAAALCEEAPVMPAHYDGRVRLDYDFRSQGGQQDSDLYGYWSAGGRDLDNGRYDFYLSGRTHSDLDDASLAEGTFRSLDDARGVIENRLQQAYVDIHDRPGDLRLRLGRQYLDVADYLQLDGAQAILFENSRFGGRAFLGVPVSYYSSVDGDFAGGLSLVGRPWTGNRTRFTYSQYHDDSEGRSDHNYFLDVQQEVASGVWSRGQISVLNSEFRMANLDLSCFTPGGETSFYLGGSRWGTFDARTRAYSPLYELLGDQEPYSRAYARMSYTLCPTLMVSPGMSVQFADRNSADYSNRDYRDYDLTLTYEPTRALSSSVSLQYWDLADGDSFLGLSGEVRFRRSKRWELGAGCAYAAYTYTSYSDITYSGGGTEITEDGTMTRETPYSLTYFLRAKWNATRYLTLRVQGDVEDDRDAADLGIRGRASAEVKF
jgi:hypothetical protein